MSHKVLRDGNGSSLIRVIGIGDYMPLKDHQAMVNECEEKSKAIFDIMAERDALAAQVNNLRDAINYSGAYKSCQELCDALNKTQQQCLAEIKAEAVIEFAKEYGGKFSGLPDFASSAVSLFADQYAAKIRNTGTWLKDSNVNGGKRQGGEK